MSETAFPQMSGTAFLTPDVGNRLSSDKNPPLFARQLKTQDFLRKTAPVFFVLFFSPFSPGRCAGPARAFWVFFGVFNGNFRQYFRNFHHFLYRLRKY
jgi:hypothetical protein